MPSDTAAGETDAPGEEETTDKVGTFSPHIELDPDELSRLEAVLEAGGFTVERGSKNSLERAVTGREKHEMWDTYLLIRRP